MSGSASESPSWQTLLGVVSTAGFAYLALRHISWSELIHVMGQADRAGLGLTALALVVAYGLRGVRWRLCFGDAVDLTTAWQVLMVGYMGNNLLPARGGELLRVYYLGKVAGQSASGTLATVVVERVLDGMVLSLALGWGWWLTRSFALPWGIQAVVIGFVVAGLIAFGLIVAGPHVRHWLQAQAWLPGHGLLHQFVAGLDILRSGPRLLAVLGLSLVVWGIEIFGFWGMLLAFHLPPQLNFSLFFMAVANFASLVPAAPAGWGTVEHFTTEFLVLLGLDREPVLAMVFSQHVLYFALTTGLGLWSWWQLQRRLILTSPTDAPLTAWDVLPPRLTVPAQLSIVIPAKDEAARLPHTLTTILQFLEQPSQRMVADEPDQNPEQNLGIPLDLLSTEIWVVDDGSQDETSALVQSWQETCPALGLIRYQPNRGKGHALKVGILASHGEWILLSDADGATPITELKRLLTARSEQYPLVVGSRVLKSDHTQVQTLWYRRWMGWVFVHLVQWLAVDGILDTQCGFKLLQRQVAEDLARHLTIDGFSFDVELLFIAQRRGYGVQEIPVNWVNQPGSKVRLIRDATRMLMDILGIRWKARQGLYERYR